MYTYLLYIYVYYTLRIRGLANFFFMADECGSFPLLHHDLRKLIIYVRQKYPRDETTRLFTDNYNHSYILDCAI